MDRCDLSLTEGELIVLRMLVRREGVPASRLRALNTLRTKVERASLRRSPPTLHLRTVEAKERKHG